MQHSGDRTKACYLNPGIFAERMPDYAGAAREFVRQRPDLRRMRFSHAHVAGRHGDYDTVVSVTVHLESAERMVDIIVSNAGFTEQAAIDTLTPEHFDKTFDLMARAPVFLVQKLLPLMKRGGSIILVGSAMHGMGIPGHTAYAASKAALRSYARTWAAEFKDRGIRVNTLSPGVTDTPILDSQTAPRDELVKMYQAMIPIGRLARAEEVASAALFLASDQSSYMTGADLMNDGGVGQV